MPRYSPITFRILRDPFELEIYEWDALMSGFEKGVIDFTAELTSAPERLDIYFMSKPAADRAMLLYCHKNAAPLETIAKTRRPRYTFLESTTMYDRVLSAEGDTSMLSLQKTTRN